jgi:hypothetical protein
MTKVTIIIVGPLSSSLNVSRSQCSPIFWGSGCEVEGESEIENGHGFTSSVFVAVVVHVDQEGGRVRARRPIINYMYSLSNAIAILSNQPVSSPEKTSAYVPHPDVP